MFNQIRPMTNGIRPAVPFSRETDSDAIKNASHHPDVCVCVWVKRECWKKYVQN